jgi:hypothetical protein
MLKAKDGDFFISDWLRNRNTVEFLIPTKLNSQQKSNIYESEADVLNMALFGITAKEWKSNNPDLKGNFCKTLTNFMI